ncbi:serine/threonine-protein kinase meng-po-like, partial [Diaphorina citri]|uniref:Serine/threonine-protein kinase meng-po-like n=1 Tax=Diaphorina citri TaxID=121845 RepID=A0A3Q0JML7_DIACI
VGNEQWLALGYCEPGGWWFEPKDTEMVLKALPKPYVTLKDFYTEFHYGLHLGSHKNIITTYDVAFETPGFYVFSQEYAPLGDLTSNVSETGIGELYSKRVAKQLAAALGFVHMKDLVHRDVKLDNVLVFKSDFSRVKLCDFGETRKTGTLVRRRNEWLPYSPPDLAAALGFVHMKDLVHRDVKLDNVLVFKSDFSRVKLCDFGETRKTGTLVRRRNEWLPYSPPDVLERNTDETY